MPAAQSPPPRPLDKRERKQEGTALRGWQTLRGADGGLLRTFTFSAKYGISPPKRQRMEGRCQESAKGCETGSGGAESGWSGATRVRAHGLRKMSRGVGGFLGLCRLLSAASKQADTGLTRGCVHCAWGSRTEVGVIATGCGI